MEKLKRKPESEPEEAIHHGAEDIILDKLHRCTDGSTDCSPRDAEILHKDFESCESFVLYRAYREHQIPSFDRVEQGIEQLLEKVPAMLSDDPEAKRLIQLIKGRSLVLRGTVRSYVETVIKFVRLQHSVAAQRDPEVFVKIDHERRRRHDNLLRSLSDTRKILYEAAEYGLCDRNTIFEWVPGHTEPIGRGMLPIFSESAIANRDLIKNWALAADFAEHYMKLQDIIAEKK